MLYHQRFSFSGLDLHMSYNWRVTAPNTHCRLILIHHFVCTYLITCITWKLQGVYGSSMHWMTTLLQEMFLFWVRATCKHWLVCYTSKHVLQSLSDNLKTSGHIWMLYILDNCSILETFLLWYGVAWEIWLESSSPRRASLSFADATLRVL